MINANNSTLSIPLSSRLFKRLDSRNPQLLTLPELTPYIKDREAISLLSDIDPDKPFDLESFGATLDVPATYLVTIGPNLGTFLYSTFYIDKDTGRIVPPSSGGRLRKIEAPHKDLKIIQTEIQELLEQFPVHPANFAFIKGKTIIDALNTVKDGDVLIHADLKDFFPSHTTLQLCMKFKELFAKYAPHLNTDEFIKPLVQLLTKDEHLPQGSPCSPIVTAIVNVDMDERLEALGKKYGLTYMRYADDICFSGNGISNESIRVLLDELVEAVHPFRLNHKKVGVMKDRAYPIFKGIKIKVKSNEARDYVQPEVLHRTIKTAKGNIPGLVVEKAEVNVLKREVYIRGTIQEAQDIQTLKEQMKDLEAILNNRYAHLSFKVKPMFFYVKSLKQVLGAHIVDNKICFPRSLYNNLRVQAMLIGAQRLLHRVKYWGKKNDPTFWKPTELYSYLLSGVESQELRDEIAALDFASRLDSRRSYWSMVEDTLQHLANQGRPSPIQVKLEKHKVHVYRDLLAKPLRRKVYQGKVNWVRTLDPNKADKLRKIEDRMYAMMLVKFFDAWIERYSVTKDTFYIVAGVGAI